MIENKKKMFNNITQLKKKKSFEIVAMNEMMEYLEMRIDEFRQYCEPQPNLNNTHKDNSNNRNPLNPLRNSRQNHVFIFTPIHHFLLLLFHLFFYLFYTLDLFYTFTTIYN